MLGASLAVTLAAALVAAPTVASAAADPLASLVISSASTFSDTAPVGQQLFYDSSNATFRADSLTDTDIKLDAGGGSANTAVEFDLRPAQGKHLHAGVYTGVHDGLGDDPDHATLRYVIGSTGQSFTGTVTITQLTADSAGNVTAFDLLFQLPPDRPALSLFGEVRLGQTEQAGRTLSAHTLEWPQSPYGAPAVTATEWYHNTGSRPISLTEPFVQGPAAKDFTIEHDSCLDTVLAVSASCSVVLGYSPTDSGARRALLVFQSDVGLDAVTLAGAAPAGVSELKTSGDDSIDQGRVYDYHDGTYQLIGGMSGNTMGFRPSSVYAYRTNADDFGIAEQFTVPAGQQFTGGYHALGNLNSTSEYGISVSGYGRGCGGYAGQVYIQQLTTTSDGALVKAHIQFTVHCTEAPSDVMTGEITWREPLAPSTLYAAATRVNSAVYVNGLAHQSTGAVTRVDAGRPLYLQRYLSTGWQTVLVRTTDAKGRVAVGFVQPETVQYRWVAARTATASAGRSASAFR